MIMLIVWKNMLLLGLKLLSPLPFVPCLSYILYCNFNYITSPLWQGMCLNAKALHL